MDEIAISAEPIIGSQRYHHYTFSRRFVAHFGISLDACSQLWKELTEKQLLPREAQHRYLLWALLFLKTYSTEEINASLVGVSPKTFRNWVWKMVCGLSNLNKVS